MKLNSVMRDRLRSAIRAFPKIAEFVSAGSEINDMSDAQMLEISARMGLAVEASTQHPHPIDVDKALQDYSMAHPAFEGNIEFDMCMHLLGLSVARRARLAFTYTPDWRYFDAERGNDRLGWEYRSVAIELLAVPDEEAWILNNQLEVVNAPNAPRWIALPLGHRGALPRKMWDSIDELIDKHCRTLDDRRRNAARLK